MSDGKKEGHTTVTDSYLTLPPIGAHRKEPITSDNANITDSSRRSSESYRNHVNGQKIDQSNSNQFDQSSTRKMSAGDGESTVKTPSGSGHGNGQTENNESVKSPTRHIENSLLSASNDENVPAQDDASNQSSAAGRQSRDGKSKQHKNVKFSDKDEIVPSKERHKNGIAKLTDLGLNKALNKDDFNRLADHVRLEEHIKLNHLEELMRRFQDHQPDAVVKNPNSRYEPTKYEVREPGNLNLEEFKQTISSVLGSHEYDDQLEKLFLKLDTSADGYVDWDEFITYMLLQYRENDYMRTKKQIPFVVEPRIRHVLHNRQEPTQRIIAVESPVRYVTVSKEGTICVWDTSLHFERHMIMTQEDIDPTGKKRRFKTWVTDVCYLANCRKIAIASTSRDIRFYDATSNKYFEEFNLYALPDVPSCLNYWYNPDVPSNKSLLIAGMDCGDIYVFQFLKPNLQLFESLFQHTNADGVTRIFFPDLDTHYKCVVYSVINQVHADSILKVCYIAENEAIISCSSSARNSLVILDSNRKKKSYNFNLSKGVQCFDYNKQLNVLLTGSADHHVRLWNPYVTSKAIAVLQGHATGVLDIVVHEGLSQIFSYSRDAVLKVWDIREHTCLQTVILKFPSILAGRMPEHGNFPFHLQRPPMNSLLVACSDYIALLRLGSTGIVKYDAPTTHKTQLCAAIYNPFYRQVVTGSDDSTVAVWDIDTGSKALQFSNAHGEEEITCMVFDSPWRRLITGARNGTIKVWNFQNGHNLHKLAAVDEAEITGIVPFNDKKVILTVGWNRLITQYDDSHADNMYIPADNLWKGGQLHQDDILAIDHCPPNLLATASFDGELLIWSTDTEKLFIRLRKGQTTAIDEKLKANLRRESQIGKRERSGSSRPNSRHRNSHKLPKGHPAPVEKLLFLKSRAEAHNTESAILISSEAGVLRWWSIYGTKHEIGHFYASDYPDETVLGLCSDPDNTMVISGDTRGYISVWDISDYCIVVEDKKVKSRPGQLYHWHAHDSAIVSLEMLEYGGQQYILSASTDKTARLWNIEGHYVGTFGQTVSWDIKNEATWKHPKTPWTVDDDITLDNPGSVPSSPEPKTNDVIRVNITERTEETINNNNNKVKLQPIVTESAGRREEEKSDSPIESTLKMKHRSQTFAFGSNQKSSLGMKVERQLARTKQDRQKRRGNFGEIDPKNVQNLGLCSPYQALVTQDIAEVSFPKDLPVAAPLFQRSGTVAMSFDNTDINQNMKDLEEKKFQAIQNIRPSPKSPYNKLPAIQRPKTTG